MQKRLLFKIDFVYKIPWGGGRVIFGRQSNCNISKKQYEYRYNSHILIRNDDKQNPSFVVSVNRKISILRPTIPVETRQASFPTGMVVPWFGFFCGHWTSMITSSKHFMNSLCLNTEVSVKVLYVNEQNKKFSAKLNNFGTKCSFCFN